MGEHRWAEWGPRAGAFLLDLLIVWSIVLAIAIPFTSGDDPSTTSDDIDGLWWLAVAVPVTATYFWLTMRRKGEHNGQTWGKQAAGIRVVRDDGEPIGIQTVLVREVFLKLLVGTLTGIGWLVDSLWPLGEREHRAIHDLATSTHVFTTRSDVRPEPAPRPLATAAPAALAPGVQTHLAAARVAETRIRDAIQRAQLPYREVGPEVESLIVLMERSAQRAQLLYEALDETPVAKVEQRLAELAGSGKTELIDALQQQLTVQQRMQTQLERFNDELERIVVELETIRGSLINVSASTDVTSQERVADDVRRLRDEMSSVATGMSTAFD